MPRTPSSPTQGDKLVIVDYYARWCGAWRALYPKLCKIGLAAPENMVILKINFDDNKAMCRTLGIKVLPFFQMYRGADGQVAAFSASLAKIKKLRDAIDEHSTDRCGIAPPAAFEGLFELEKMAEEESKALEAGPAEGR